MPAALLTVLLLAACWLTGCSSDSDEPDGSDDAGRTTTETQTEAAAADGGTSTPSPDATGSPGSGTPAPTTSPGVELPPSDQATPSAQPSLSTLVGRTERPLVPSPLPAAGSATGELVDGFPEALRPLARSEVVTSSLSVQGTRLQVALEATTPRPPQRVLRGYRLRLARHGAKEGRAPAVGGAQAVAFRRGSSALVLTVRRGDGLTTYTVSGVLRAEDG